MGTNIDHVGRVNASATPDRRPSLNTQAAIDAYDYRFACWEVIDGADLKAVCHRLDVPGGPSVLGPKVVALRARLEACAKVGRPPPQRPTEPPVSPLTNAHAAVPLESWSAKGRPGVAIDATANPSAKAVVGRALVTRATETSAEAPAAVPDDAPWRQALKLKVTPAAVQAVAEQEGLDPVKALRAAGFTQEAEKYATMAAEVKRAVERAVAGAVPSTDPVGDMKQLLESMVPERAEVIEVLRSEEGNLHCVVQLTPAQARAMFPPPLGVSMGCVIRTVTDDAPASAELAAEAEATEALWEQTHSEETVRAAQAEHARQRALLHQLGEEEQEEADVAAHEPLSPETLRQRMGYPEPPHPLQDASPAVAPEAPPAAPVPVRAPVARGRSTQTLAASAATEVVKAPLRGRTAPPSVAPPTASAPPATSLPLPLPLPTWTKSAKAEPSDPPPKRDRSKNRKVAPKPPEPAQPVLLGMSPETTTPTNIGRPKRRKVTVPTPAPAPVVKVPKVKAPRAPKAVAAPKAQPALGELTLPERVRRDASPEVQQLLLDAVKVCRKLRTGRMPQVTDAAPFVPIDLAARTEELHHNAQTIMRAPRPAHAKLADRRWHEHLARLVKGEISASELAALAKIPTSTVMNHLRRTGGSIRLLPYIDHKKGMRPHKAVPVHPINAKTGRGLKRLRAKYALTPGEFAGCLGVTPNAVIRLERGLELPRPEVIRAAVAGFGLPWREVLNLDDDAWLLKELIAISHQGRAGVVYRHMLAKFVLPEFGLSAMLEPTPTRKQAPPTTKAKGPAGRIEARPSNISEWSRVRYAVLLGEKEIAYADTLKAETPERVRQLLQNQLVINARQGGDGLPRGWLGLLPADLGPGVSGRLKEELMEFRDQIDNIEHALGLPARYWSGPDQECDADLTDAERAALKAPTRITDRARLLIDPTAQDSCTDYSTEPQARDCDDDGHYLCEGCGRFDRARRARDFDVDDRVKS